MVRLSLSIILFSLCAALVKVPVSPTISPTVNSKIIDGGTRRLGRQPIVTDVTNIRNVLFSAVAVQDRAVCRNSSSVLKRDSGHGFRRTLHSVDLGTGLFLLLSLPKPHLQPDAVDHLVSGGVQLQHLL